MGTRCHELLVLAGTLVILFGAEVYVVLRVRKHDFFEREDNHLTCEIALSFIQASLGITIEIPLLLGGEEKIKIPAGTQSGEVFRIKGGGVRDTESRRTGDLYVRVIVRTPDDLTKDQKALLRQLAELRGESLEALDAQTVRRSKPAGR
jgi:molecular chaperone DnaJ